MGAGTGEQEKVRKRFLLTLCRQGIYTSNQEINNAGEDNFFVMDYFDKLAVEEIGISDSLAKFLGMVGKPNMQRELIAVQRYSIYKDYEAGTEERAKVLFKQLKEYPYLGLIHVYITPDVLVGLQEEILHGDYMSYFEKNLSDTVGKCCSCLGIKGEVFCMMSESDYMVVVRSRIPEEIYVVSNCIRQCMIKGNPENQSEKQQADKSCLAIYKTYTIHTLHTVDEDIPKDVPAGKYAIRGRYSNLYWKKQGNCISVTDTDEANGCGSIMRLNGRYDFLLYLNSEEFWKLRPLLHRVKCIGSGKENITEGELKNVSGEFQYIVWLLKNEYLSYVNERYLLSETKILEISNEKRVGTEQTCLESLFLDDSFCVEDYLSGKLERKCGQMEKKISDLKNEMKKDSSYSHTMIESTELLLQLVGLCANINGLSDVRLNVISLLSQINVVVESLILWMDMYPSNRNTDFMAFMNIYLRQSVASLEEYGKVMRSSNLQTLQAPRYHIVAGNGTERIMTCYSHFLKVMMDFCRKELKENGGSRKLVPVMIPQLNQNTQSVEVMFPEWPAEKKEFCKCQKEKEYLMVVIGPATSALVEMADTVTTFFHEMAHQIRYEERSVRNKVILELFLEDVSDELVKCLFEVAVDSRIDMAGTKKLQGRFVKILTKKFKEKTEALLEKRLEWSLENFKFEVQKEVQNILKLLRDDKKFFLDRLKYFFDATNEYVAISETTLQELKNIGYVMKRLDEPETFLEKVPKDKKEEEVADGMKQELTDALTQYIEQCKCNAESSDENNKIKEGLSSAYEDILAVINDYKIEFNTAEVNAAKKVIEDAYKTLCDEWRDVLKASEVLNLNEREWIQIGRKFGIDIHTEDNKKEFLQSFARAVRMMDRYDFARAIKRISLYREETSDMFMCMMCKLDLTGYLTLCAHMHPNKDGNYSEGFIQRFTDVVIIIWLAEDKRKVPEARINKSDREELNQDEKKLFGLFLSVLRKIRKTGEVKTFCQLQVLLENCWQDTQLTNTQRLVAGLAVHTLNKIPERLNWYSDKEYLYQDALSGKKKYQDLSDKFQRSCEEEIKCIREMCRWNSIYLNEICEWSGKESGQNEEEKKRIAEYRTVCENFIMNMFYLDKASNAIEGRKLINESQEN